MFEARRGALHRARRRRLRRRPGAKRAGPERRCSGKILRIDPRPAKGSRRVPDPRATTRSPTTRRARPEILAYGLRNPWRFSFDRQGGTLWIGDVGQSAQEEIDVVESVGAGANLGWSAYRGDRPLQRGRTGAERARARAHVRSRRGLLHHRGLRRPRPRLDQPLRALPLRGFLRRPAAELQRRRRRPRARPRTTSRSACRCPRSARSPRTRADTSTRSRWRGPSTGWSRRRAMGDRNSAAAHRFLLGMAPFDASRAG